MTKGVKFDQGKLDHALIDADAENEFIAVLTFGATLYGRDNWALVEETERRYFAAARRHMNAARMGHVTDPAHGLLHLAGAACSIHFLLALELRRHPELVESLPERLGMALQIARELRAKRFKEKEEKDVSLVSPGWVWRLSSPKGRLIATGTANTLEEAEETAQSTYLKRDLRLARITLFETDSTRALRFVNRISIGTPRRPKKRTRKR